MKNFLTYLVIGVAAFLAVLISCGMWAGDVPLEPLHNFFR